LDSRFGVETNVRTKPFMVAALQQFIKDRAINVPCEATIGELVAFEQERSQTGLTTRYRGAGGSHDDRVMSLVIGASVALSSQVLEFGVISAESQPDVKHRYTGEWAKIHEEMGEGAKSPDPFDY
jgi:hypothetical protein